MTTTSTTYYDSDLVHRPVISEIRNLWDYRGLIRLLVVRDLTVRYKRSSLGVWWTLLNPLLTMAVMWVVFGNFFRFEVPGAPYVVYLLSGILLVTYFSQGVVAVGSSIVNSASVLSKVFVPPEVFAFTAATAAATNFIISLLPLVIIQIFMGVGVPWTIIFVPIPIVAMVALVAGLGLLVASAAVYFYDVLDLTGVLVQLLGYLTPSFYPISIIPASFLPLIYANPLYSYLLVFRGFVYEGSLAPWWAFAVMFLTAAFVFVLGVWVFSRSWRRLVVLL